MWWMKLSQARQVIFRWCVGCFYALLRTSARASHNGKVSILQDLVQQTTEMVPEASSHWYRSTPNFRWDPQPQRTEMIIMKSADGTGPENRKRIGGGDWGPQVPSCCTHTRERVMPRVSFVWGSSNRTHLLDSGTLTIADYRRKKPSTDFRTVIICVISDARAAVHPAFHTTQHQHTETQRGEWNERWTPPAITAGPSPKKRQATTRGVSYGGTYSAYFLAKLSTTSISNFSKLEAFAINPPQPDIQKNRTKSPLLGQLRLVDAFSFF